MTSEIKYLTGQEAVLAISNNGYPEGVELCIVCRVPHKGVTTERSCLIAEVLRLREEVEKRDRELADIMRRSRGR